jgi:YD repeat-containing protein
MRTLWTAALPLLVLTFSWGAHAREKAAPQPPATGVASVPTTTYTYDAAGRLLGVSLGSGVSFAYTYDAAGNLLSSRVVSPIGDPTGDGTIDVFDAVALSNLIVGNVVPGQPPFLGTLQSVNLNPSQGPAVDVFDLVILMNFIVGNYTSIPI